MSGCLFYVYIYKYVILCNASDRDIDMGGWDNNKRGLFTWALIQYFKFNQLCFAIDADAEQNPAIEPYGLRATCVHTYARYNLAYHTIKTLSVFVLSINRRKWTKTNYSILFEISNNERKQKYWHYDIAYRDVLAVVVVGEFNLCIYPYHTALLLIHIQNVTKH